MSLVIGVGDCFAANPPHEHQTTANLAPKMELTTCSMRSLVYIIGN